MAGCSLVGGCKRSELHVVPRYDRGAGFAAFLIYCGQPGYASGQSVNTHDHRDHPYFYQSGQLTPGCLSRLFYLLMMNYISFIITLAQKQVFQQFMDALYHFHILSDLHTWGRWYWYGTGVLSFSQQYPEIKGFRPSGSSRRKSRWPVFSFLPRLRAVYFYTITPIIV